MKLWSVLALGLGFVSGTVLPTSAQPPLRHGQAAPLCDAPADVGTLKERALLATVTRVDAGQGRLEFTTATGAFVLTTPAALADLRVGDQVLICLHEEGNDGQEGFAEQARPAEEGAAAAAGAP
jgi:hypothetical protein